MKKLLIAAIASVITPNAIADFIGIHGSLSSWQSTFSGEIAGTTKLAEREAYDWGVPSFEERGFEKNGQLFGYIALEHPIPIIPNIRLGMSKISDSGTSPDEIKSRRYEQDIGGNQSLSWDISQFVHTELNIDALDFTLYYEILDNWVNLDLGLTVRQMTGEFIESTFEEVTPALVIGGSCEAVGLEVIQNSFCIIPPLKQVTDIDFMVPMIYAEARFDLPFSGFYAGGRTNFIAYSGNKVVDLELETGYMYDLTAMELGVAIGYRTSSLKADDLEGLYSDAKLEGFYASMNFHF